MKRTILIFLIIIVSLWVYVEIVNINSVNMTLRQRVLKAIYPVWMWYSKARGRNASELKNENREPPVSFYSLKATLNNNQPFDFASLKGKKVMLVNTASDCGYTRQYDDLERL